MVRSFLDGDACDHVIHKIGEGARTTRTSKPNTGDPDYGGPCTSISDIRAVGGPA